MSFSTYNFYLIMNIILFKYVLLLYFAFTV